MLARDIDVSPSVGINEQIEDNTGTLSLSGSRAQIASARQVWELGMVRFMEEILS